MYYISTQLKYILSRYAGLGLNVSFSYIGNIISLWFFTIHLEIGIVIYICVELSSAILLFLLKETNEKDFEDILAEDVTINDKLVPSTENENDTESDI